MNEKGLETRLVCATEDGLLPEVMGEAEDNRGDNPQAGIMAGLGGELRVVMIMHEHGKLHNLLRIPPLL